MTTQLWSVLLIVISSIAGAFASVMLKVGSSSMTLNVRKLLSDYKKTLMLIGGLAIYGLGAVLFTISLRGGELTVLYPIASMIYIFSVILSRLILKERLNVWKLSGVLLIVLGAALIGLGS